MIKTRTQLNALIRNKAAGDGDKAKMPGRTTRRIILMLKVLHGVRLFVQQSI